MAKAKKRPATRKRASKRGKASAKPERSKASMRATSKKRAPQAKTGPRKAHKPSVPVIEDTIIDVVDEPIPGVIRVTEYETIRTTKPKRRAGPETDE
jgi:hypothetical protein